MPDDATTRERDLPQGLQAPGSVHRIVRNSVFTLLVNGLCAISYLVVFVTLTRCLERAAMGEYYTLYSLIIIVQMILEVGTTTVVTKRIAAAPLLMEETLAEATPLQTMSVAAQIVLFLCMGLVAAWYTGQAGTLLRFALAGCASASMQIQRYCAGVFRAFELFRYENLTRLLQATMLAASVVALVWLGAATLTLMIAVLCFSQAVAALCMFVGLQRRYRCLKWRWNLSKGKDWLAEAIPLGISDTVRGQGWQLDTVLLGLLQPAAVVGIYSAAYRPLTMLSWLPLAAAATTFPTLVRLAGSPPQFNRAVSNSIRLLWMSGLPLAVVICLGAEHVVTILAGRAYLEAAIPMRILVWRILLSSLTILYRFVFAAAGKLPTFARLVVLASALDAAVELLLIPTWGYLGACCGSLLGELVFAVGALLACRRVGIDGMDWRSLGCIGLAGSGMGALLWGAGGASLPRFVLVAAVSTALYFLSCLLLRALRWGELRRLYDALASWNEPAIEALEAVPEQEIGRVVGLEDLD